MSKPKQKSENSHPHFGHRQRLKDKIRLNGLSCLSLHEVLEYLLTYTIPRKDTNELAHNLISKYNGFCNVFSADINDLKQNKGVGEETALFLTSLNEFVQIFLNERYKNDTLTNIKSCVQFFRRNFSIEDKEHLYFACLNKSGKVLKIFTVKGIDDSEINLDLNKFNEILSVKNVCALVAFHTHPGGSTQPSVSDYEATQTLVNICCMLGVCLYDHIILNETSHFSFGRNDLLREMYSKFKMLFPKQKLNYELLKKFGINLNVDENEKIKIDEEE